MVRGARSRWSASVVLAAVAAAGCDDGLIRIRCPPAAGVDTYNFVAGVSFDGSAAAGGCGDYQYHWTAGAGTEVISADRSFTVSRISLDGSTVLGSAGAYKASFRWTAQTGVLQLTPLSADRYVRASDLSADGSVVVGTSTIDGRWYEVNTSSQPFRWTEQAGMETIGPLPGAVGGAAVSVSADGHVIVGHYSTNPPTIVSAPNGSFVWSDSADIVMLPDFVASAVNRDGSVVVGIVASWQAAKWTRAGGVVMLASLPGDSVALASAVSADGGTALGISSGLAARPVLWSADGTPVDISGGNSFTLDTVWLSASADAALVLAIGQTNTVIWDAQRGARPSGPFHGVSADGRLVFYSAGARDAFLMPVP